MASWIESGRLPSARRLPVFQSLVEAIIYQQLNSKAADTIFSRFKALFGDAHFPSAEQVLALDLKRLRSAGLSKPKANYVRGVAERAVSGALPTLDECDKSADAEIVQRLIEIKGVGRWTVEMFLIFNLGRLDVLPVHDLGVRKGFQIAYGKRKMPEPEQLERLGRGGDPIKRSPPGICGERWIHCNPKQQLAASGALPPTVMPPSFRG